MDPIAIAFYAVVCGLLGLVAPSIPRMVIRLGIGAMVGVVAAILLPWLRGVMHLY